VQPYLSLIAFQSQLSESDGSRDGGGHGSEYLAGAGRKKNGGRYAGGGGIGL